MDLRTANQLGYGIELSQWGELDLSFAPSDKVRDKVTDVLKPVTDSPLLSWLFPKQETARTDKAAITNIMGLDPKMVYIAGGALGLILLIAAFKK